MSKNFKILNMNKTSLSLGVITSNMSYKERNNL